MSTAAIERHALRTLSLAPALALAGATAFLLARLWPDVSGKPFHEDEAVAGLISARPLGDLLHTVVLDRGGAPLHFLLAHTALAVDPTAEAVRWVSVLFALATVPLCYDLTWRIAGRSAGLLAAGLAATSQFLLIYGTFGRMYSLFAFASALGVDLFVRALARPTRRTAVSAAASALLPLTVHPFGAFLFAAEAAVALWLWRGRSPRTAAPVLGIALLVVPLLLGDLRLSDRYVPEAGQSLDGGTSAGAATLHALGGAAGGRGVALAAFVLLAAVGVFTLARRNPAIAALASLTIAAPPVALAVASASGLTTDRLGPRHLIFMLPLWIALVAAGASRLGALLPRAAGAAALAAVVGAAALAPASVSEPRVIPTGAKRAVRAPAEWLRTQITPGAVLYPYSPVFLAALPAAKEARGYSREPVALARIAARTHTTPAIFISIPLHGAVATDALRRADVRFRAFTSWLILEARGPFVDGTAALESAAKLLRASAPLVTEPDAHAYIEQLSAAACAALVRLDSAC
ncbi:MAG: glycosyltransferase family 39 protein [Actinobacteria bacterium]|nr:glycosyltransferase family 39 protein [Actinomycetota bacterium]